MPHDDHSNVMTAQELARLCVTNPINDTVLPILNSGELI